jgi:phospholipid transport system substrate-binding protein
MGKVAILLITLLAVPVPALAEQALQAIETRVNRVLEVVNDLALKDKAQKEEKIQSIVDEIFDYAELSRRTLAVHWRSFTPEQQKEFTHLFGKLLRRVYMDRILAHTNEKVVFGREIKLSGDRVEVESEIVMRGRSIPIRYRMILQKDQWKVYDVVIEGVSLVQNYRSQFREILAKEKPEGLLRILRQRVS